MFDEAKEALKKYLIESMNLDIDEDEDDEDLMWDLLDEYGSRISGRVMKVYGYLLENEWISEEDLDFVINYMLVMANLMREHKQDILDDLLDD